MASTKHGSSLGSELLASRAPPNAAPSKATAPGVVDAGLRSQQHCTFRCPGFVGNIVWCWRWASRDGLLVLSQRQGANRSRLPWFARPLVSLCHPAGPIVVGQSTNSQMSGCTFTETSILMLPNRHTSPSEMAIRGSGEAPPSGPMGDAIPRRPPVCDTHPFP